MSLLFYKMRIGKKGQIASLLVLALVMFIIAAFIVVNFGKNRIQDVRTRNAVQAGVLAGGSATCVALNSMANLNDAMIMNFAGFTVMIQFMLISWLVDYVKCLYYAFSTLTPFNFAAASFVVPAVLTLCLTTAAIAILLAGVTKLGKGIYKMIDELNAQLPKNSRDSARQYALSNAGIDVPKIPFSKSGCADAACYAVIETKFDEFMRLLPVTNKADLNYATSILEFDWDDSRTGNIVNNKVEIIVTPVQKVPLRLMDYDDVGSNSGVINAYLDTQDTGLIDGMLRFGVDNADLIIKLIWSTAYLIGVLAVILWVITVVNFMYMAIYYAICFGCSWFFCACCWACPFGVYYNYAAIMTGVAAVAATAATVAFFIIYNDNPPEDIPAFVWDKDNVLNSYPLTVQVVRTTNPETIDYGVYKTDWPVQSSEASGIVRGGSIFPPKQEFDTSPIF